MKLTPSDQHTVRRIIDRAIADRYIQTEDEKIAFQEWLEDLLS